MTQRKEPQNLRRMSVSAVSLALVLMLVLGSECRPSGQDMDPVDLCIFTCDFCYKGEALVKCANECITMEGTVGPIWLHTCRLFGPQQQLGGKFRN